MKPVKLVDSAFLHIETPETPMHVGALFVLAAPTRASRHFFEDFRRLIGARLGASEVFTRRPAGLPWDLVNPMWVTAGHVDLEHHVRRHLLPEPGGQRELHDCVARLHESLLDRSRPLWELHVIEGLAGGGRAIYAKTHHAGLDGHSAQLFLRAFVDESPQPARRHPVKPRPRADAPRLADLIWAGAAHQASEALRLPGHLAGLATAAKAALRDSRQGKAGAMGRSAPLPRAPFNVVISGRRSFAGAELGLAAVKAVAREHASTINDVVLASVAGAVRRWLVGREALPAAPLHAGVPVSARAPGDTEHAIQVAFIAVNLHTDESQAARRLAAIHASAHDAKQAVATFKLLVPEDAPSIGLPWIIQGLGRLLRFPQVADRVPLPFNLIVSNVPGPPLPFYIAGARVLTYYPVSIPFHGNALNISVYSYDGRLFFGLTACPDALPDVEALAEGIPREFAALARPARRAAGRAKAGRSAARRRKA
jgi:diacylglycerol O-acyltransferase / wax synthase